jgi:hypothetical protein
VVEARLAATWVGLLGIGQLADLGTTALDQARGAVEAMPATAALLSGGLGDLAAVKLLLVSATAVAVALTFRWSRRTRAGALLYWYVLNGCRVAAIAISLVSLHNAILFSTLG